MDTPHAPSAATEDLQILPDGALAGLDRLNQAAISFIRQRPGTAILGAVAVGFIVGKIAARY